MKKTSIQAAADQAAVSAANSLNTSTSGYNLEGKAIAAAMGFVDGQGGVTVTVNNPPTSGPRASSPGAIEVVVSLSQAPMLSRILHPDNYVLYGRAVATVGGPGCVLALDPSADGALIGWGNTTISMPKCNWIANSSSSLSVEVGGSASVTVNGVYTVGGISADSGLTDNLNVTGAAAATNPYTPTMPSASKTCQSVPNSSGNLTAGTYCNGITVNSGTTYSLCGTYIFAGGTIKISGGGLTMQSGCSQGVTIVMTSTGSGKKTSYASIQINGNSTINLTAPSSGNFSGIVLYDDPGDTGTLSLNGGSTQYFGGAIVAAGGSINYTGTAVANGGANSSCTQLIADKVAFSGNSTIYSNCAGYGTSSLGASKTVMNE